MKTAVEPETVQVAVHTQERFLVHILRVLRRPEQVHRQPKHTLVVSAYELPKGVLIAFLSSPYERLLVYLKARFLGQRGGSAIHVSTTQNISVYWTAGVRKGNGWGAKLLIPKWAKWGTATSVPGEKPACARSVPI